MSEDTPKEEPAAKPAKTTRVSPVRVGILIATTVAVIAAIVYFVRPAVIHAPLPGPTNFAGYVDVTNTPQYPFETPAGPSEQDVILAFIVSANDDPCTPTWGTYYTLDQAASGLELDRRIEQLRITGGNARVSFGGQANQELAIGCTDPAALEAAYQSVVDRYQLATIDLDIEGPALSDLPASTRRATAIKSVQDRQAAAGKSLSVWLTLPVDTGGLTDEGIETVQSMLAAGVDLAGVNGMTMNFGGSKTPLQSMADAVIQASTALHGQVQTAYAQAGQSMNSTRAWGRVGITPMIGQNDTPGEVFTLTDAEEVNDFARAQGVGLVSMWNLNRDQTCTHPLPTVITVVQGNCSGIDQAGQSFADVLGAQTDDNAFVTAAPSASASPTPTAAPTSPVVVDDPATSPFPIWDPLGTYPAGSKVVWKRQVYQAKYYTSGFAPDTPVANAYDTPWTLLGPVLPGDKPAPLPTLPADTYDQWNPEQAYVAGARVQVGLVPYQAKWWTQGQKPGENIAGGSPWMLVYPAQ